MHTAFLFDLDGTVTRHELLPIIAKSIDLEREFATLTALTIDGTIPFEDSFRLRFAMLRNIAVDRVRRAIGDVELDADILEFIAANRDHCHIVTGNLRPWIEDLAARIGCGVFANDAEMRDGSLVNLKPLMRKSEPVFALKKRYDRIVAIGDGANDVPMFEASDISIAYGGVHLPYKGLLNIADYAVFESRALCRLLNTL